MATHQVLIAGQWRDSDATGTFQADNPQLASAITENYPISSWDECSSALDASVQAFVEMRALPRQTIAKFLEDFADRLEANSEAIRTMANLETALPLDTRLVGELGRTTGQLRQAAAAASSSSWCLPTIDTESNIRSCYAAMGPVAVFGPNNFPLAFGSISGGDFAAAIAAGNPVIAKANPMHPGTTKLLAEQAQAAAEATGMPAATVQLIYHMSYEDGERFAADPRLASLAFTGSRKGGLKLKAAADAVGKPIYLELSSVNPVVILPGALSEKGDAIADELTGSCLMGTGQFCTNPGLILLPEGVTTDSFAERLREGFSAAPVGTLLSKSGQAGLASAVKTLQDAGAELICGASEGGGEGYSYANTILRVSGDAFLQNSEALQTEAFGNATLLVVTSSIEQTIDAVKSLEGNLTGCIYSDSQGSDDSAYDQVAPYLQQKVGRLLNDKMPTGVAVSAAMNHGGPFPATAHAGFTAVGIPGSLLRFSMLKCFDNVRPQRLPAVLQDANPDGVWRLVDGEWSQGSVELVTS